MNKKKLVNCAALNWLYISGYMKATKMGLIWLESGDPPVPSEYRTSSEQLIDACRELVKTVWNTIVNKFMTFIQGVLKKR